MHPSLSSVKDSDACAIHLHLFFTQAQLVYAIRAQKKKKRKKKGRQDSQKLTAMNVHSKPLEFIQDYVGPTVKALKQLHTSQTLYRYTKSHCAEEANTLHNLHSDIQTGAVKHALQYLQSIVRLKCQVVQRANSLVTSSDAMCWTRSNIISTKFHNCSKLVF